MPDKTGFARKGTKSCNMKQASFGFMPLKLFQTLEATAVTKTELRTFTGITNYLLTLYFTREIPFSEPVEVSQAHFRKNVGEKYTPHLIKLKSAGVILTDDKYYFPSQAEKAEGLKGRCKQYRFAPHLLEGEISAFEHEQRAGKRFNLADPLIRQTVRILSTLKVPGVPADARKLAKWMNAYIGPEFITGQIAVNEAIPAGSYQGKGVEYPAPLETWQRIAAAQGVDVILYHRRIHLQGVGQFVAQRLAYTRAAYAQTLYRIKFSRRRTNLYCSRNETNYRLDHNVTGLRAKEPANLLKFITLDGEKLQSIDLRNSQITIFAHLFERIRCYLSTFCDVEEHNILAKTSMRAAAKHQLSLLITSNDNQQGISTYEREDKEISYIYVLPFLEYLGEKEGARDWFSSDWTRFKNLTKSGIFYDELAAEYTAMTGRNWSRSEAKTTVFEVLFSAHRNSSQGKRLLQAVFPSVVRIADAFKVANIEALKLAGRAAQEARDEGNASLAITLQRIEARVFIDGILADCLGQGLRVLSKHDSLLFKPSERHKVEGVVRAHLDRVFGPGAYELGE